MLDRTVAPPVKLINRLPEPQNITLSNGLPVHIINMGTQDVLKMQLVFRAGRPFEKKRLVAKTTSRLLKEGSRNYSSADIAEEIDFYGATLATPTNLDNSNLVFYTLNKHFGKLIPLVAELLLEPVFPQEELDTFVENSKRRLKVDLTKTDVVAYRKVTELIFGTRHPYGYNSDKRAFNRLRRVDLVNHYKKHYNARNCQLFISGKVTDDILQLLDKYMGAIPTGRKSRLLKLPPSPTVPQKMHIPIADTLQTAIRIGKKVMTRAHPDFTGFTVLNTILGGYFGSRLMMNIREDKGYTYNIYSTQDTMLLDACFYVSTEVGNEFVEPARKEIYREIEILQTDLVPDTELNMVKNYMLGNMLNLVDGPFNVSDVIRALTLNQMSKDSFDQLIQTIIDIDAQTIRDLAQRYLNPKEMWEVTAG